MNSKNLNYSLILSALFLLGLAGIVSFGYMGYRASITNNSTLNAEILNPQNIMDITGNTSFALDIDIDNLSILNASNTDGNYIEDTKEITINTSFDKNVYSGAITCEYEFYYEPEEEHVNSEGVGDLIELGFAGECTNCSSEIKFEPISIGNVQTGSQKSIYTGSITTVPETGKATQNWSLHYRFYNLNLDQSGIVGEHPSGKIIIQGKNCYQAKNN